MPGAIVHEWVATHGGSENVFEALSRAFPAADLYALWSDRSDGVAGNEVAESWLARSPLRRHKPLALPFMPPTWRSLRSQVRHDWVLASSHLFAHHVRFTTDPTDTPKYVYAHTPARYIWSPELDRRGASIATRLAAKPLRSLDRRRAKEPTAIAANSAFVAKRVEQYWRRDAEVIHPPVAVERFSGLSDAALSEEDSQRLDRLPRDFILGASRWIPYKRLDLVVEVGDRLDLPVVLAGAGPEKENLIARARDARVPVYFIESPSNVLLAKLYKTCAAFVFPPVEDFGIMPVEAMAAGAPTVVNALGGAQEGVASTDASVTVDFADMHATVEHIRELLNSGKRPHSSAADHLSEARFAERMHAFVGVDITAT